MTKMQGNPRMKDRQKNQHKICLRLTANKYQKTTTQSKIRINHRMRISNAKFLYFLQTSKKLNLMKVKTRR